MRWQKRAQASVEFLMIVGVAMTMFLPMLFVFQQFSSQANERVIVGQLNSFGRELVTSVESMYYFGEFSKTTLKFNFPDNVVDMQIYEPQHEGDFYEIVLTAYVYGGFSDFVYYTRVPIAKEKFLECDDPDALGFSDLDGSTADSDQPFYSREEAFKSGIKTYRVEALKDKTTQRLHVAIVRDLGTC